MNRENLTKALEKSQFISDPETMNELLFESETLLTAAYPDQTVTPQAVVGMAQLIMYYEEGAEGDDELPEEPEIK